jgi:hypothetical protein
MTFTRKGNALFIEGKEDTSPLLIQALAFTGQKPDYAYDFYFLVIKNLLLLLAYIAGPRNEGDTEQKVPSIQPE